MLFVCIMLLFLPLISANAFYFHALSLYFDTLFVYFIFLASCTVLLICLFFLILCSHRCCVFLFFYERAMSFPEKLHLKITIIIIIILVLQYNHLYAMSIICDYFCSH